MENKINVAELLKDCPSDMELNCVMFENLYFDCIDDSLKNDPFPICCYYVNDNEARNRVRFSKYGTYLNLSNDKCVIFPKGKDTWEGFVPPCKFKDGDIVAASIYVGGTWMGIFKQCDDTTFEVYCSLTAGGKFAYTSSKGHILEGTRLATEEEKDKFFQVIKRNGYKWNAETKTLERIIKPKFKVGDRIKHVVGREEVATVVGVKETYYILESKVGTSAFTVSLQCEWELVSKFDISTLNPFDKVLVRNSNDGDWACDLFSHLRHENSLLNKFRCIGVGYRYCIPYEGNEHLRGTNNDCDEFYKTWE